MGEGNFLALYTLQLLRKISPEIDCCRSNTMTYDLLKNDSLLTIF